jgi:glutamate dehydrogenase (NAD(P)+)
VLGDPDAPAEERQALLNRFFQSIAPILRSRVYVPAPDMGTDETLIRAAMQAAGSFVSPRQMKVSRSGEYTALTVFHSLRMGAASLGMELAGKSAAIEGFGKVGAPLARLLAEAGVRVVAVSTSRGGLHDPRGLDVARLAEMAASAGSRLVDQAGMATRIPSEEILTLPVDFLLPCAGFHSIHDGNCAGVQARLVCPGANNPATPTAEASLRRRGVIVIPDFVANNGGVLGSVLEFACLPLPKIREMLAAHVGEHLPRLIGLAGQQGISLRETAENYSRDRFSSMEVPSSGRSSARSMVEAGMWLYHRGLVPGWFFARLAEPVLRRRLGWRA